MSVRLLKLDPVEEIDAEAEAFEQGTVQKLHEAVHGSDNLSGELWSPAYDFAEKNLQAFPLAEMEAGKIMDHYEERLLEMVPETERDAAGSILGSMYDLALTKANIYALFCTVVARSVHDPAYLDTVKAKLEQ